MNNRRTRSTAAAKTTKATNAADTVAINGNEQYFDSPKRKDCKIDGNCVSLLLNGRKPNSPPNADTKGNTKNTALVKSKKQTQAITNFFHLNDKANDEPIERAEIGDTETKQKMENVNHKKKMPIRSGQNSYDMITPKNPNENDAMVNINPLASPQQRLQNGLKQTTPHRIMCPSSPTKKQKLYTKKAVAVFSNLNIDDGGSPKTNAGLRPKKKRQPQSSRRKLNINELENVKSKNETVPNGTDNLTDMLVLNGNTMDNNKETLAKSPDMTARNNKKPILNSTQDPTAQQNTTNNKPVTNMTAASEIRAVAQKTHDTQMTDFFPIRRSVRKTQKEVEQEHSRYIEIAIEKQLEDGLVVKIFPDKGRGIVAGRPFVRGEFVVEYIGELIGQTEADRREESYAKKTDFGCYMYYFKHKEQQWCIDATTETGKLGRLVNHSRNGNLATKIVSYRNKPHLVLLAKDNIKEGDELTYDYGDRRREALIHHPWLAF